MNHRKHRQLIAGRLLRLLDKSYWLAVRVLGGRDGAERVLEHAYGEAVERLSVRSRLENEDVFFLGVVVESGRAHLRGELERSTRWASVHSRLALPPEPPPADPAGLTRQMVNRLEERHRVPLALCFEHGLSAHEAAEILGQDAPAVERRASDALRHLCEALGRHGLEDHPEKVRVILCGCCEVAPPEVLRAVAGALSRAAEPRREHSAFARLPYEWKALAAVSAMIVIIGVCLLAARAAIGELTLPWQKTSATETNR